MHKDPKTGQITCQTGNCGSTQMECNGKGASPPVTLAEFTIGSGTQDFYDVSLVDGYNLAMMVEPSGGSGTCLSTGCANDLNRRCPSELTVGSGEACKSACEAFGKPEYCCRGAYAYDDATSTFTCTGADYTITFCPSSTSKKSASNTTPTTTGGTTSPTYGSTTGPGDVNISSWFPDFVTGQSSKTSSAAVSLNPLLSSAISFLFLLSLHFVYH
ncbi:Pathoproteinsis-related protein 5 [Hibiscus syriacus]|uniref:Pathoproteinsis-related protein 5 n=1 Tax=Hibiscus syriacus TaxID=106335 RepID=A0A6A3B9D6_HIBSY|nr:Pathoproteinsis-related protein 5 [Hibiscus syriacus]